MASVYRINGPNIIHEAFEDEVIVLNMNNGYYFSLSKVSADIWKQIGAGATIPAITQAIKRRYHGDELEIESAVSQFVTQLAQENLVAAGEGEEGIQVADEAAPKEFKPFQAPSLQKFSDMQEMLLLDPIHDVDETGWPGVARVSQNN